VKIATLILITIFLNAPTFAQQPQKADYALLLDYYQSLRFADAADYLKKIYPEPVTDLKILSSLAYASQMAGRLPAAEDYYQRIYATDTANTAILFNLGSINARRGNNAKAINFYKKILISDNTNFNVFKQMASLSQNVGNTTDAIYYLQKANKINPVEPDVAYDLSTYYINLKFYKRADTAVTVALKADSSNLLLLFGKAQIDYRLEKYPETVEACNKLIIAGDQNGIVISMLGTSYYNLKNYNSCIATFKLLEQSNTASETSYYYTGMSYKALGDQTIAVVYFDKAIKEAISSNVNSYYGEMADSFDQLHKVKKAVNAYQKSLLYGVMPLTYYALGNLYDTELKNKSQALRYYKKYINSSQPESERSYIAYSKRRIKELTLH